MLHQDKTKHQTKINKWTLTQDLVQVLSPPLTVHVDDPRVTGNFTQEKDSVAGATAVKILTFCLNVSGPVSSSLLYFVFESTNAENPFSHK